LVADGIALTLTLSSARERGLFLGKAGVPSSLREKVRVRVESSLKNFP